VDAGLDLKLRVLMSMVGTNILMTAAVLIRLLWL
jgi:hypothetical protein